MKKVKADLKKECGPFKGRGSIVIDNFVDIYIGDCKKIKGNKVASLNNYKEAKSFRFQGECCDYLYFICWSDDKGLNGLLAALHGDLTIYSGAPAWEVFATGKDRDRANDVISINEINTELKRACEMGWQKPFVGQKNDGSNKPFPQKTGIDKNANFIWYNNGNDTRNQYPTNPYVPFIAANHDEFLIFRLPLNTLFAEKCIDCKCAPCCKGNKGSDKCGCNSCNKNAAQDNKELLQRAEVKAKTIGQGGCPPSPFEQKECKSAFGKLQDIKPCVYLHWGDSSGDVIENHDTEILYITVCNPFTDVELKGFQITKVALIPTPSQKHQARIIPDRFVDYGCLEPCTCKTREFTLLTRDHLNLYTGAKQIEIEYCWDETVLAADIKAGGRASFPITIIKDED